MNPSKGVRGGAMAKKKTVWQVALDAEHEAEGLVGLVGGGFDEHEFRREMKMGRSMNM